MWLVQAKWFWNMGGGEAFSLFYSDLEFSFQFCLSKEAPPA